MDKIIGFLITKDKVLPKVDIFNIGLKTIVIKHGSYYVFLWGLGNINKYKIDGIYSLSFPLNAGLLDRNLLIGFKNDKIVIENDWLGSIPVFYNKKHKIISTLSNFCIKEKHIHQEGLANYCEFGYSVFEQTIFTDVMFMRYYSKLIITNDNVSIVYKSDPLTDYSFSYKKSQEKDVISLMQKYVSSIEDITHGQIILPTSGGYDSRLLNYLVKDKNRIRSFTYGISKNQSLSSEVVYAKEISEIYNTVWQQIELKDYNKYIDNWFQVYGISTHLHGMYHIEFYKNILKKYQFNNASFLSGIFGDIWSGNVNYKNITNYQDVINLGYTHDLNLDLKYLKNISEDRAKKSFYKKNKKYIKHDKFKSVFTIRIKLMLISYLCQLPEYFGFPVWTPFLNFNIVMSTLNISDVRRKDRIWQSDFFREKKLNLEEMNLKSVRKNNIAFEVAKKTNFEPIDINIMGKYIFEKRLLQINKILNGNQNIFKKITDYLIQIPKIGGFLIKLGFENDYLKAINEYYVVKSIEKGIKYGN